MKGLLHRLAARAAGTALPVRSDARLPFGAGTWGDTVTTQVDAAATTAIASPLAPPPTARTGPAGAAAAPATDLQTAPELEIAARADHVDFEQRAPSQRRASAETTAKRREERLPPRLVREDPDSRAPIEPPPARVADVRTRLQRDEIAALPPSLAQQATPFIAAPASFQSGHAEPERLMPAAIPLLMPATASAMTGQPAWAGHSPARAERVDEPTEVHVHIGRIDVTAVHEPAAPLRRRTGAAAPMSLDTYLAKRGRS